MRRAADDHRVRRLRRVLQRTLTIPSDVRRELERHARAELPNEACGLIVLSNGIAERYVAGRNRTASAYRFELEVDPETWFLEDDGYELAVFHSHVASPARPSRTDIENIGLWRGRPYLIFSLLDDELHAFTISAETVTPLELRDVETV